MAQAELKSGEENVIYFPKVSLLSSLPLNTTQARLSTPANVVGYDLHSLETNDFHDRAAYVPMAFADELKSLEQLSELLRAADKYVSMLYSYRSVSKALPMVGADTDEKDKIDVHRKTFAILRPEILKLKDFLDFHEKAVKCLASNMNLVLKLENNKIVPSEELLDLLLKGIDMLILLDALKDMKACLQNDFSRYKRSFNPIRSDLSDSDALSEEMHNLQMFLSNPQQPHNLIMFHLKTDLQKLNGYDIGLSLLIDHCVDSIDAGRHLLPSDFHLFHRVIPYLIYLMDSEDKKNGVNVFKMTGMKVKFKMERIQKLLKQFPIIPLYADMHIDAMFVLRKCPHWVEEETLTQFQTATKHKLPCRYELKYHVEKIRKNYTDFTMNFSTVINEIRAHSQAKKIINPKQLRDLFDIVKLGLIYLSTWVAKITEQCAYKYSKPRSDDEYKQLGGSGKIGAEYEKAVKYNYTNDELYALIDVISMIKGLAALMMDTELIHGPLLRRGIHDEIQIFLQQEVARPLRKAHKRNRKDIKQVMLDMRDMACDWINRDQQKEDFLQKKKDLIQVNRDFHRRATAPSVTQISLIRRMMNTIFSPRAQGMQGGIFTEKDLKKEWIPVWEKFYMDSFFYSYLLNFSSTIDQICDMSFLWYREFYLEVTKAIQFPIGMSLPWILTEFVIKTPPLKENIFFPIEIYNDAAMKALRTLNQQFLYDEIEAECNLSFGQLIFHLSEDIFQYFKTVASSVLINKTYEQKYFTIKPSRLQIYSTRYVSLLSQRHIQLLGRSIDLSKLLTEQLNSYFRRNVDYAIRRYESGNIMGIIELSQLLENARMTHYLLSDFLHLDSFEEILKEVNEDVGLGSFRGRIALHSFSELVSFLFPSCIFNEATQRFVLGSMMVVNEPERSKSPQAPPYFWYGRKYREAFERQIALTKNYFGVEHVNALVNVLNYTDIPLIVNEVIQEAENKLIYDFAPYARALNEALPPFKLPKLAYRAVGGYGSYDVKLKTTIAGYGPLKPKVFQMMREMGNALLFLRLLDHAQTRKQDAAFLITAPLFGIRSQLPAARNQPANIAATTLPDTPFIMPSPDAPTPVQTALRDTFASLSSSPLYAQKAKPEDAMIINDIMKASDEAHKIYSFEKERPSFVTGFLNRLSAALDRSVRKEWEGTPPTNAQPVDIENPRSIARLLSAFQFIFHKVPEPAPGSQIAPFPDLSIFGEGWMYCLCMFVHITGWRHRFELMDFSYHVMRLATLAPPEPHKEEKKKKGQGPTEQEKQEMICNEFVRVVRAVKQKNDEIFSFLASYFAPPKLVALTINSPTAEDLSAAPPATGSMNLLPRASISVAAAPSTIGAYAGHGPSGGFHQYQPSMSSFPTLSAAAFSSLAAESAAAPEAPVAPEAPAVPDARPSDDLTAAVGSDDVYAAHHNQQNSGEGYAAEQYSGGDQSYQQYAAQYDQAAAADPYQQPVSEEQSASEVASLGAANPPPPPPPPAGGAPPPPPPPPPAM